MLKKFYNKLSFKNKSRIRKLYHLIFNRKNYQSFTNYSFSDETNKFTHILESINYARIVSLNPVYFEFGCYSGRTFSAAINAYNFFKIKNFSAYAFDSFRGLPENEETQSSVFKAGSFSMSKINFVQEVFKNTNHRLKNQFVIEGFYEDTLNLDLQNSIDIPSVIHIDVDLYISAKSVFRFIAPLLRVGTVILIDDWYCFKPGENKGLQKAFNEFLDLNKNIECEHWKNYSTFGRSFFVKKI